MSEIRENRLTGEWVIIAPERAKRGGNLASAGDSVVIPPFVESCPFCPGNEGADERFRLEEGEGHWIIRSVDNKFSVLSKSGELSVDGRPTDLGISVNGVGPHEVLIEGREHHLSMALYPPAHVRRIVEAYRNRFRTFYSDPRVRHVIVFKNHGAEAGASQQHPHSQIVGLPIVPGQILARNRLAQRFYEEHAQCLACTMIAQEEKLEDRIVCANAHFVAFVPYAALSPYHVWVFPRNHGACFSEQSDEALGSLAEILRAVLARLHQLLNNPAFNLVIRSLGPDEKGVPHFHWYLSMIARVNKAAGFELGTGMYVNPSSPELSARALREVDVPPGGG